MAQSTESQDPTTIPYVREYLAAFDRNERYGFWTPPRVLVRKDCVKREATTAVITEYFSRHEPQELVGQSAAIHMALGPLIYSKTGVPCRLTIGWAERQGRKLFYHDDALIERFIEGKTQAWLKEGLPFHLWFTSPAAEVIDVTFALNLGWAETEAECAELIVYQSASTVTPEPIYHPMLVGPDFFIKTGGVL